MKCLVILAIVALSIPVHAQVLKRIDLTKEADVSRKTIDPKTLKLNVLPETMYDAPTLPSKRAPVKQQTLTHQRRIYGTVDVKRYRTNEVKTHNFVAKRAKLAGTVKTPAAKYPDKAPLADGDVGGTTTPEAVDKLKEQLNKRR